MWKKPVLLALALAFMLIANLDLCCRVTVNGRELEGLYSPSALDRSETAAACAAEEILSGRAVMPELERSYRLSLRPAGSGSAFVTGSLLRSVTGVKLANGVFVNGVPLGTVADSGVLFEKLRDYIGVQMPNAAVFGSISGELRVRPVYSRSNRDTDYYDMILLVSGMAPVFYLDESGKLV